MTETIESIQQAIDQIKTGPRKYTDKANLALLRGRLNTLRQRAEGPKYIPNRPGFSRM